MTAWLVVAGTLNAIGAMRAGGLLTRLGAKGTETSRTDHAKAFWSAWWMNTCYILSIAVTVNNYTDLALDTELAPWLIAGAIINAAIVHWAPPKAQHTILSGQAPSSPGQEKTEAYEQYPDWDQKTRFAVPLAGTCLGTAATVLIVAGQYISHTDTWLIITIVASVTTAYQAKGMDEYEQRLRKNGEHQ